MKKINKKSVIKSKKEVAKSIGYKVVRKIGNKLMSCSVKGLKVQYIRDQFSIPRMWGGPVTLFNNVYDAIGFIKKLEDKDNMKVYRSEYEPTIVDKVWRFMDGSLDVKNASELPVGTVLAKKIKILKKVF